MKEKQIRNGGTATGLGFLDYVGASVVVSVCSSIIVWLLLSNSVFLLVFSGVYLVLALLLSFIGALIGNKLTNTRMGMWIGAIIGAPLAFWLLYSVFSN